MKNLPQKLCDLDEDEEIRIELPNGSEIEEQMENLKRLNNFWRVASESCMFSER